MAYMELENYLRLNCDWKNRKIISNNELLEIWKKANYKPTSKLVEFLSYFYNLKAIFEYKTYENDIDFRLKKILKDHPYHLVYDQYINLLNTSNVTPFGEIQEGYMVLLADDKNNIYGVCDHIISRFGNDYLTY